MLIRLRIDRLPVLCLLFFRCLAGGRIWITNKYTAWKDAFHRKSHKTPPESRCYSSFLNQKTLNQTSYKIADRGVETSDGQTAELPAAVEENARTENSETTELPDQRVYHPAPPALPALCAHYGSSCPPQCG
ncbi:hypothetical protein F511_46669 [Dorcoceras hygrometricum]|uniref:Uncharacterized protein n=1 Tax=Dorcoceras hygrometricum TaxID=472368 RepID=A0A2Z6ZSX5_9LAMI|nr:hypothetical protein F511_46669 [Dorcoceras hygrometricum]